MLDYLTRPYPERKQSNWQHISSYFLKMILVKFGVALTRAAHYTMYRQYLRWSLMTKNKTGRKTIKSMDKLQI